MSDSLGADGSVSRRSLLTAAATGVTASTAGCVQRFRNVVNREGPEQLSLTITTLPADSDRKGIQLARRLRDVLEQAGANVAIEMQSASEFLRTVLVNHDFDICVARHPGARDPDFLYEALHSQYADEAGWQNPFGYTNLAFDEGLEAQRRATGDEREAAVGRLLETFVEERPFVPVCVPEEFRIVRTDRFDGWGVAHPATRMGYLELEPIGDVETLRTIVINSRPSQNLNPLSVEYRSRGTFMELLYDSLATERDDEIVPWLATTLDWTDRDTGGTFDVTLRSDLTFHDGEPLTADDVAFTYRLLEDTALEDGDVVSPAPRYRGQTAAVESVTVDSDRTLSMDLNAGREVAERALTVPILPEHVWRERAEQATLRGYDVDYGTTEAVVEENVPPIGSGPFAFEARSEREYLTFERFADHFTLRSDVDLPSPSVERFRGDIDPRSTSAISIVEDGDADMSLSTLETYALEDFTEGDGVELLESPSWTFYYVGFNARKAPYSNPHFRRAVARLLDRKWLVETVFDGHARPTAVPVTEAWTPDSLAWDGEDPIGPFVGSNGSLDVDAARETFESAGFRYDETGTLLVRQ